MPNTSAEQSSDWTRIRVTVPVEQLDGLIAVMSMINNNLMIEDLSDIDLKTCYGDLIDESILNADKTVASVSVFLPAERPYTDEMAFLNERMKATGINGKTEILGVREEDWANSWKAYYKPVRIGRHMVIVPRWEKFSPEPGDVVVRLDPGMAFGTGTHETTRLVIGLLEDTVKPGQRVLDVGCGSGILSICASMLGARECRAYDIDPMAVRVAGENVADCGVTNVTCEVSDLLRQVDLSGGQYDIICANIVADIIIRMAPDVGRYMKEDGVLLASGIITERVEEVERALTDCGLRIDRRLTDNGWCALVVRKM